MQLTKKPFQFWKGFFILSLPKKEFLNKTIIRKHNLILSSKNFVIYYQHPLS